MEVILMQSQGGQGSRNCVSCGRPISFDANVCPYCGHDYRVVMAGPQVQKKESASPVAGGVLILLGSLVYFLVGGLIAAGSTIAMVPTMGAAAWGVVCGVIVIVLGLMAFLGGIYAIGRKNFNFALIGGIFVIPTILGLIGLVLVAVSKDEFVS